MTDFPIFGVTPTRFARVEEAFRRNFAEGVELGAAFAVFIEGECVVDLIGGFIDKAGEKPWTEETLAGVYSSGKAVIALLIARAAGKGLLDYDARVACYWPEFAANGKGDITLGEVLSHQAGLVGVADEMPPEEWLDQKKMPDRIAAMAPLFAPRSASGYSPQLVGIIANEVLQRVSGRTIGQTLREDFVALDIYCGLSADEMARAAYMPKPPRAPDLGQMTELKRIAFLKPWSAPAKVSREDWMAAELPSSNMHMTARALAEFVQPLANEGLFRGEEMLTKAAIGGALKERIRGDDLVLPFHLAWCAGLMKNINRHFGPNAAAFGHAGFGGSSVVVDPDRKLTAAYVMSKMSPYLVGDPRGLRLVNEVYVSL